MITESIAKKLNNAGVGLAKIFNMHKVGSEFTKIGEPIKHTLVAADISSGVATVQTNVTFSSFAMPVITASDGTIRAITKIVQDGTKLKITATNVAATDVAMVVVYQ